MIIELEQFRDQTQSLGVGKYPPPMTVGRTKKLKSSQGSREGWTGAKNSIFKSRKKRNILGRKNSSCWMIVSQLNLQLCFANTLLALSFIFCVNLNGSRRIPMDRGAWWAAVHEITKSWTPLSDSTTTSYRCPSPNWHLFPTFWSGCFSRLTTVNLT